VPNLHAETLNVSLWSNEKRASKSHYTCEIVGQHYRESFEAASTVLSAQ